MYAAYCPMCDSQNNAKDEYELLSLSACRECGFDFSSNRCSNTECGKLLNYTQKFCGICGHESEFYINSYDVRLVLLDG